MGPVWVGGSAHEFLANQPSPWHAHQVAVQPPLGTSKDGHSPSLGAALPGRAPGQTRLCLPVVPRVNCPSAFCGSPEPCRPAPRRTALVCPPHRRTMPGPGGPSPYTAFSLFLLASVMGLHPGALDPDLWGSPTWSSKGTNETTLRREPQSQQWGLLSFSLKLGVPVRVESSEVDPVQGAGPGRGACHVSPSLERSRCYRPLSGC